MAEPTPDAWRRVDTYLTETLVGHDADLESAVAEQNSAGLPAIEVAPVSGKLLHLLVRISGARRVLEIGTLGAYSTIWMARGIPDEGTVITIEAEPANAAIARTNLDRAGVGEKVDIRIGRGDEVLPTLQDEPPFDFVFIDADKQSTADYFTAAMQLIRPGGIILVDNVVRDGKIADPSHNDADLQGIRRFNGVLAADRRVCATMIQTVGAKGYDGFTLIRVAE